MPDGHHVVSHHQHDPMLVAKKAKIDTYHVELLREFLEKLRATPDGDGSLLDHVDGSLRQRPRRRRPPLASRPAGPGRRRRRRTLKGGRHLKLRETPMSNLLVTLLGKVGAPIERLGDSTGPLTLEPISGV